jgi:hypothetical protein
MPMTKIDEESKLLENLEGAMQSARSLEFHDLELILKMAVLEVLNQHAGLAPKPQLIKGKFKSK